MNERVLILGGTSDLATAIAHQLASKGYDIILGGRKVDELKKTSSDISIRHKVECESEYFDANDTDSHEVFFDKFDGAFPENLFVVFGYLGDQALAEENTLEAQKIMCRNYTGAVSIINSYVTKRNQEKIKTVVGVSSVAGDRGRMSNYIYGSAKAGFTAYLSGLRNKLFHEGIHVMTVRPGFMDTKMTEGLDLPKPITASPEAAAKKIIKGWSKKKNDIYVLPIWGLIMLVIRNIPEFIFKRLKL
ncbi:SDR family oxidoreductase [Marinigracilibium pacificum]|uniref:SDR family oxidoreductase n=1 Tax=Marinigracilibium pacificum TaxID=2729599 RepID=A0A848IZ13_9BACT|nr:SDR family oxidoreductase [Marinigracilibium pacificum]NMM47239.1 SDR family oxidoreductase [Marinigracilibium pacificum]